MKRLANLLADMTGNDQRQDGIMGDFNIDSKGFGRPPDEIFNTHILLIGNQIGLAVSPSLFLGQQKGINKMINIQGMIQCFTAAEHGKESLLHPLEDHKKPFRIARAVNGSRSQNDAGHTVFMVLKDYGLGPILGLLIIIGGIDRRIFIGRWIINIAVHATG